MRQPCFKLSSALATDNYFFFGGKVRSTFPIKMSMTAFDRSELNNELAIGLGYFFIPDYRSARYATWAEMCFQLPAIHYLYTSKSLIGAAH